MKRTRRTGTTRGDARPGATLWGGAALAVLAACGPVAPVPGSSDGGPPAVVHRVLTVSPGGDALAATADPVVGLPDDARLVRLLPDGTARDVAPGLASHGDASFDAEGQRLVFVARRSPGAPFSVFTARADGRDLVEAVPSTVDCARPAFLPDGRIVYAAVVDLPAPRPEARRAFALHVGVGDGTPGKRITFGAGLELDPAVLGDGRVVFVGARGPAGPGTGDVRSALFTVHPDGSGVAGYRVRDDDPRWLRRPVVGADGTLSFLAGGSPLAATGFAVSSRDPDGDLRRLEPPALSLGSGGCVLFAATGTPRPRPQGHLSVVDAQVAWGRLLGLDARFPATSAAARVRVRRFRGFEHGADAALIDAPLASDGSFYAEVPPDAPLLVDVLDAEGKEVRRSTTPIWVRPHETRGCVGCHEPRDVAPRNRYPLALDAGPVPSEPEVAR